MATLDNREILRYRGVLTPSDTTLQSQQTTINTALLNIENLNKNVFVPYYSEGGKLSPVASNPFMRLLPQSNATTETVYDFYFPFTPQNIQYSDLSDEISEIQRAGTTPLVTFKSHRLLHVSFEFLVAIPYDGMTLDVESSLEILRVFSTSSNRGVIFFNMDKMMTSAWQYRRGPASRPLVFNIAEMSITAKQRNSLGKITQAIVNITVVENQNPTMVTVKVPPFTKKIPKKKTTKKNTPKVDRVPAYSSDANAVANYYENGYLVQGVLQPQ